MNQLGRNSVLVGLVLSFGACAGGENTSDTDASTVVDATSGTPDSQVGLPDSGLIIDSGVGTPDAVTATPDAMLGTPDAMLGTPDAGFSGPCNPVTQAGCGPGEKCAENILSAAPFVAQTVCLPNGTASEGQACTDGTPGPVTGYDDCQSGLDCFQGECKEICGSSPDTCRPMVLPFDQGAHCAANFQNHFTDEIGVCTPACDPTDDVVVSGVAVNAACNATESCGLNAITVTTSCSGTPAQSATQTQNEIPFGPGAGQYFSNGCASGFTTLLNSTVGTPVGPPQCARFCTPSDSYLNIANAVVGTPSGVNGKCDTASLNLVGGVNSHDVAHQCRFIQGLYTNTDLVPDTVGLCMPIVPNNGGDLLIGNGASAGATFGDCSIFEWEGLRDAWNAAAPMGTAAADAAFNQFCLSNPNDPANSVFLPKCVGIFFACVSLATEDEMVTPSTALTTGQGSAADHLRSRLKATLNLTQGQSREAFSVSLGNQ